jgi:chromosome segregation ATPase
LSASREDLSNVKDKLKESEEQGASLQAGLNTTKAELEDNLRELQETKDRVFSLEQDAAGEFRGKIRLLERQLADQKGKAQSLEEQLETAKQHGEQYREMSEAYEQQLQELNRTSEEFK